MTNYKAGRFSSDLQRIISGMIPNLKDPRIKGKMLTIVRCEVTRDRSSARVYVSSMSGIDDAREAVSGLESASGMIKREVSDVLHMRKAPELKFIADDSSEYSAHISKLLKEMDLDDTIKEDNKDGN